MTPTDLDVVELVYGLPTRTKIKMQVDLYEHLRRMLRAKYPDDPCTNLLNDLTTELPQTSCSPGSGKPGTDISSTS